MHNILTKHRVTELKCTKFSAKRAEAKALVKREGRAHQLPGWQNLTERIGQFLSISFWYYHNEQSLPKKAPRGNDWSSLLHVSQMIGPEWRFIRAVIG